MSVLQPLGPEIWTVEGPASIDLLVVPYPTRMTIVRLDGGDLWISSPVSVPKQQLDDVAALGPVRHLLAPTPPAPLAVGAMVRVVPGGEPLVVRVGSRHVGPAVHACPSA